MTASQHILAQNKFQVNITNGQDQEMHAGETHRPERWTASSSWLRATDCVPITGGSQCILLSCQPDARKTATIVWDAGSWKSWCNSSPKAQKCICSMWLRAGDCAWIAAGCKCIMYSPVVCASWTLQLLVCHVLIGCQRIMHRTRCILYSLLSMHHILISFRCTMQLPNVYHVLANPHVMSRRADRLKLIVKAPNAVLCLRLGTAASDWEIMIVPGYQVPGASYMTLPDFIPQDFLLHQVVEFSLSAHLVFQPCSKPRFKVSRYINSRYTSTSI